MITLFKTFKKPITLAKIIFFFVYAAGSVLIPFLALYYEQRGLSGAQIGLLASIPPVMTMLGTTVWGSLADATRRHKLLVLVAIASAIMSATLIPSISSFVGLGLVIAFHSFCFMSLVPLIDNSALEILGDQSEKYGQIRLWGSLGYGLGAPLIGPLVEQFGLSWNFYGHAALMLGALVIAIPLPVAHKSAEGGFGRGLKTLLQDPRWHLFLLIIFVAGFGDAIIRNYSFLYLKNLGASSLMMGLSLTIGTVSELGILFYSSKLLKSAGPRRLLIWSVAAQIFRLVGWSLLTDPYLALSLQLLNGLTFAAMWLAAVAYAKEIAPTGLGATAQGILSGMYFGFSSVVGALAGGFWYDQAGTWGMYRWGAVVMFTGLMIFILAGNLRIRTAAKQPAKL